MNQNIFCPLKDFNECDCEKNSTTCRGKFMVVEKKEYIYIVVGKSASTSIIKTLNENRGKYIKRDHIIDSKKYKFSFVRNPFPRLVSGWKGWINVDRKWLTENDFFYYKMPFKKFIETLCFMEDKDINYHFAPQTLFLYENDKPLCNYIGKVENISEDWEFLREKFKLAPIKHLAKSGIGGEYEKFYTSEMKKMVFNKFEKDFNNFDYDF